MSTAEPTRSAPRRRRPLAAEIVEALESLGGAAHSDRVFEVIVKSRTVRGRQIPPNLRADLKWAFDSYCDSNSDTASQDLLFTLPFGPDSRRWALRQGHLPTAAALRGPLHATG